MGVSLEELLLCSYLLRLIPKRGGDGDQHGKGCGAQQNGLRCSSHLVGCKHGKGSTPSYPRQIKGFSPGHASKVSHDACPGVRRFLVSAGNIAHVANGVRLVNNFDRAIPRATSEW